MGSFRLLSATDQVARHLRLGLRHGRWVGAMPGINRLAAELGVNNKTVELALGVLQGEGLLESAGPGRRRRITMAAGGGTPRRVLRVRILPFEPSDRRSSNLLQILSHLREAGHEADFAPVSLTGMGMEPRRVARAIEQAAADAWLVVGGSREVNEWFASVPLPVYLLFGSRAGIAAAAGGVDKVAAFQAVARRLVELGHRRIVMLTRRARRAPRPTQQIQAFLDELELQGVRTGPYNLPDWGETVEGFHECLDALFRVTPPTALVMDGAAFVVAAQHFLLQRGLRVPGEVSVVCTDSDPAFDWCRGGMGHVSWELKRLLPAIGRWADQAARGRQCTRQTLVPARFIGGTTIGPPPAAQPPSSGGPRG